MAEDSAVHGECASYLGNQSSSDVYSDYLAVKDRTYRSSPVPLILAD